MYLKCQLTKQVDGGTAYMQSWIKAELAVPGRAISRLEDPETGVIENEWKVVWATEPAMPESTLLLRAHRYDVFGSIRKQRRYSAKGVRL